MNIKNKQWQLPRQRRCFLIGLLGGLCLIPSNRNQDRGLSVCGFQICPPPPPLNVTAPSMLGVCFAPFTFKCHAIVSISPARFTICLESSWNIPEATYYNLWILLVTIVNTTAFSNCKNTFALGHLYWKKPLHIMVKTKYEWLHLRLSVQKSICLAHNQGELWEQRQWQQE